MLNFPSFVVRACTRAQTSHKPKLTWLARSEPQRLLPLSLSNCLLWAGLTSGLVATVPVSVADESSSPATSATAPPTTAPAGSGTLSSPTPAIPSGDSAETAVSIPIGADVGELELQTHAGTPWTLTRGLALPADQIPSDRTAVRRGTVVCFVGTECPLVQLYIPRLKELAAQYADQGIDVVAIASNRHDSLAELAQFARRHELTFPLLHDPGNRVADRLGAERTPETILINAAHQIVYRGRIDDQHTYGIQRPTVEHEYLREAMDALLADKPIEVTQTETVGCLIGKMRPPRSDSPITFASHISGLLQTHCVRCHRPGEIGPFALTDYEEVAGWASMIGEVVREERMPPWHADPEHGKFSNDARLPAEAKQMILDWVAAGAPAGDLTQLPPPTQFTSGWQIAQPDRIIKMADKPYEVPATGAVPYQYFAVDPGFEEDVWVQAAECRPGNRSVVHHIIILVDPPGRGKRARTGGLTSDWLTATAPGAQPLELPHGLAKRIPAGSKLIFQMHYTPNGKPGQTDLSELGLIFADPATVEREVATQKAYNDEFTIPAQANNFLVEATTTMRQNVQLLALFPHMHLRGKAFRYTARFPDGTEQILLNVPRYDFNWQNGYVLETPLRLPAGTKIECVAHFDNSAENLANPDPTAQVRWGDQTWEEMMIGYFDVSTDGPPSSR